MRGIHILREGRWQIVSAGLVILLNLLSGLIAERWWLALNGGFSMGLNVSILSPFRALSVEPVLYALATAISSTLICLFSRSWLVHLTEIGIGCEIVRYELHYVFYGAYFGCDRNGCSAEDGFAEQHVVMMIAAIICGLIAATLMSVIRFIGRMIQQA